MLGTSWAQGLRQAQLWVGAQGDRLSGPAPPVWGEGVLLSLGSEGQEGVPPRLRVSGCSCRPAAAESAELGSSLRGLQPWRPLPEPHQAEPDIRATADPSQPSGQLAALLGRSQCRATCLGDLA